MGLKTTQEQIRSDECREALKSLAVLLRDQQMDLEQAAYEANMGKSLEFHVNQVLLNMRAAHLELLEIGF